MIGRAAIVEPSILGPRTFSGGSAAVHSSASVIRSSCRRCDRLRDQPRAESVDRTGEYQFALGMNAALLVAGCLLLLRFERFRDPPRRV
jgi:hypothetical protein